MEKVDDRHQKVVKFLESLGLNEVRIERLSGNEGRAYRYYAWRSGNKAASENKRVWSVFTLVEDSPS